MLNHVWSDQPVNVNEWLKGYAHSRYGKKNPYTEKAWDILHKTVYAKEGSYETIVVARPTFEKDNDWAATDLPYDPLALVLKHGRICWLRLSNLSVMIATSLIW
ncbi:alpha-N-acetylglucosaminidase C-terminal domain-containing protein [Pedobacter panaciterrae]